MTGLRLIRYSALGRIPKMRALTAADAVALHERADAHGCTWAVAGVLPVPWIVDHTTRTIWVDERLTLDRYYEAVQAGLDELGAGPADHGTVVPFRYPRRRSG